MVSLILTTLNEEATIGALLDDILKQTTKPDELIIVDGNSRDHTVCVIRRYEEPLRQAGIRLVLRIVPGANIARGRNEAIAAAQGHVVAVTDAGCRLDSRWLERIVEPLRAGRADFVGGFYRPVARTRFQRVLALLTTPPRPTTGFLPSSRSVAFTKSIWDQVGGYPEWLPWGEDTLYNRMCLKVGARYEIAAEAVVYWEVRRTFRDALKQYFRYAFGDGLAASWSASYVALQGVYWGAFATTLVLGPWGLGLMFLYALAWVLRRRTIGIGDLPLAYVVALGIQSVRFVGFTWGLIARCLWRRRPRD